MEAPKLRIVETQPEPTARQGRDYSCEIAVRRIIDSGVFALLRTAPSGSTAQVVYMALARRLPKVFPSFQRIADDTGMTRRNVIRGMESLQSCGLVRSVQRRTTQGDFDASLYELTDLRGEETVRKVNAKIQAAARKKGRAKSGGDANVTTGNKGGGDKNVTAPGGPCSGANVTTGGDGDVGEVVTSVSLKEATKETNKQQQENVAAVNVNRGEREKVQATLEKHKLGSAGYLADPEDPRSLTELVANLAEAPGLIDRCMKLSQWSESAGTGARVQHLRQNIAHVKQQVGQERAVGKKKALDATRMAQEVIASLPAFSEVEIDPVPPEERSGLLRLAFGRLDLPKQVQAVVARDEEACRRLIAQELREVELGERVRLMSDADFLELQARYLAAYPSQETLVVKMGRKLAKIYIPFLEEVGGQC